MVPQTGSPVLLEGVLHAGVIRMEAEVPGAVVSDVLRPVRSWAGSALPRAVTCTPPAVFKRALGSGGYAAASPEGVALAWPASPDAISCSVRVSRLTADS